MVINTCPWALDGGIQKKGDTTPLIRRLDTRCRPVFRLTPRPNCHWGEGKHPYALNRRIASLHSRSTHFRDEIKRLSIFWNRTTPILTELSRSLNHKKKIVKLMNYFIINGIATDNLKGKILHFTFLDSLYTENHKIYAY